MRISPVTKASTRWFGLATLSLALFVIYTMLLHTGSLSTSTFQIEQWLLQRPITRLDCVFMQWQNLGDITTSLLLAITLGVVCLLLGYKKRILLYLLLLLMICVGVELVGKQLLSQPLSRPLRAGMMVLSCPQINGESPSVQLAAYTGMWWHIPHTAQHLVARATVASHVPVTFDWYAAAQSYPGGHAMRWIFLWGILCWLCWQHIKQPVFRVLLTTLTFIITMTGGWMPFYIGVHLVTDTLAGYLFGAFAACSAIGLLLLNKGEKRPVRNCGETPLTY